MNVLNKRYDPAVPVDKIKPNPRNVNEGDVGQLSVSISENGFYGALIVNERTGYLVAGEHRWRSAIGEGATTLPVLFIDCDAEHERKILLADNRTSRLGSFNNYALAEELQAIQSDYGSLIGTGFDDDALQELINDLTKPLVFEGGDSKPETNKEQSSPGFEAKEADLPTLRSGGKQPFQQMTFTLHDSQAEQVKDALDAAKKLGDFVDSPNENSNGNALARVCEIFVTQNAANR